MKKERKRVWPAVQVARRKLSKPLATQPFRNSSTLKAIRLSTCLFHSGLINRIRQTNRSNKRTNLLHLQCLCRFCCRDKNRRKHGRKLSRSMLFSQQPAELNLPPSMTSSSQRQRWSFSLFFGEETHPSGNVGFPCCRKPEPGNSPDPAKGEIFFAASCSGTMTFAELFVWLEGSLNSALMPT